MLKHRSLCTGIGGFDLAAEWMEWENISSCEYNNFCNTILKKRYEETESYGNIYDIDATKWKGTYDILTAGFPCQPYSYAGKRKGTKDPRDLREEVLRIIRESKPAVFVGENVAGIVSMEDESPFEEWVPTGMEVQTNLKGKYAKHFYHKRQSRILAKFLDSLEKEGYQVQVFNIPAIGVQAPHQRSRIWIVAYNANQNASRKQERSIEAKENSISKKYRKKYIDSRDTSRTIGGAAIIANSNSIGQQRPGEHQGRLYSKQNKEQTANQIEYDYQFQRTWMEVASQFCGMDDGLPDWMDQSERTTIYKAVKHFGRNEVERKIGIDCSKIDPWRKQRLAALGNSVVPQVPYEIFKAIEKTYFTN